MIHQIWIISKCVCNVCTLQKKKTILLSADVDRLYIFDVHLTICLVFYIFDLYANVDSIDNHIRGNNVINSLTVSGIIY